MKSWFVLAVSLVLSGCGSVVYTKTTDLQDIDRGASCEFRVLTAVPNEKFQELGVLELNAGLYSKGEWTTSTSQFKEHARPHVCKAGGDAIIGIVNGYGYYVKGTVIRFVK